MNKEYNDNREYNLALDSLHFSKQAKARMTDRLLNAQADAPETGTARRRTRRTLPRYVAVAAAAALLATAGAGAAGVLKTAGEAFSGVFGASAAETEIIDKIGYPAGASDTSNGVTVTADAIIGDKYHYAITYSIAKEDGTAFDLDLNATVGDGVLPLGFEDWDTSIGYMGGMHGGSYFYDADPSDNSIQYIEMMEADGEIPKNTVKASFKNLYWNAAGERRSIAEGKWKLKFDMRFEDTSVSLPAGQRFELNGMNAVIDEITLSPIALRVDYTVDSEVQWDENAQSGRISDHDSAQWSRYFESLPVTIHKKNGEAIDLSHAGGSIKPGNGKTVCQKGTMLEEVIPLEEVASITVGEIEIEVQV